MNRSVINILYSRVEYLSDSSSDWPKIAKGSQRNSIKIEEDLVVNQNYLSSGLPNRLRSPKPRVLSTFWTKKNL